MSAFFLYNHENNQLGDTSLKTVAEHLVHFSWVKTSSYSETNIQLIYTVNKEDRLRIFEEKEGGLTFILHGNIFESLSGIEKIDGNDTMHALETQLIKHYLKNGIRGCAGLNGMYNLLVWNKKDHTLQVAGDRLGIFQIFFVPLSNGRFVITSDIATLKFIPGYSPKVSKRGIFDILYMGVAFENRTVLEGVERLLPNACYHVSNGKLKLVEKFRVPFSQTRWSYVTPKLLDELNYYYTQAIRRQLHPKRKIIFLQSGGKDSRLFSYFLKQAEIVPHCVTVGERHHGEVFLARNVCKIFNFPWQRFPMSQKFNSMYAQDFLEIDGFSGRIFSPFLMEVMESVATQYDYSISTFVGDPIFGSTIKKAKLEKGNSSFNAFNNYLSFWRPHFLSEDELKRLFPDDAEEFIQEYQKESFQLFNEIGDEPYQSVLAYSLRSNDRFKVGGVLRSINSALPTRLPCIDNDLMDFMFSLPPALLCNRQLMDIFLVSRTAELATIPIDRNSSYYSALVPSLKTELRTKLWSTYVNKIKFPVLRRINPISATTQFYIQAFSLHDKGFKKLKIKTLSLLPAAEEIFDVSRARYLLERELPSGTDHIMSGNAVRSLITAVLTAQSFK